MNTAVQFLTPRLVGKRFEDHAIPFEVLKNMAVLEDLVIEAAKWKYLQSHPDRKRVPRGFTEETSLKLTEVRDGSAIPVIALTLLTTTPMFPEIGSHQTYFEMGRDAIIATVTAAEAQTHGTDMLPSHLLGYFDQLGRSLRDGEALELNPKNLENPARLTKETRRWILLQSDKIQELTEEVVLRGMIPEMDQERMTFEFQLISGPRIKAPLEVQHLDSILEAFNGYRDNRKIMVRGIGSFNRNEKLLGLSSVEHVSILDDLDTGARLEELKTLKNGWLDSKKGIAPKKASLDWLTEAFQRNYPGELTPPYLYPTAEGGVQAEWSFNGWEISLEIDIDRHQGQWHALDMANEQEQEKTLDLDKPTDWQWLTTEITRLTGGKA